MAQELEEKYNGIIPSDFDSLIALPGVGRKTANVVLALGFNIPAMPVDTHLYRMAVRLGYIRGDMDVVDAEIAYKKYIPKEEWTLAHHLFLLFGRYFCKAINPNCKECALKDICRFYNIKNRGKR